MGTTATGLSSTPGTIVTWPLNSRSPFSATTQPSCSRHDTGAGAAGSNPTEPGTVVYLFRTGGTNRAWNTSVPVTSTSAMVGSTGTMPPIPRHRRSVLLTCSSPTTGSAAATLTFSQQPESSFASVFPGSRNPGAAASRGAAPAVAIIDCSARANVIDGLGQA
jgi:hypothetical protein